MSREDLMRISRALALFRPSVLASMMNLTEDDLIFTEKCLQRTLLVSYYLWIMDDLVSLTVTVVSGIRKAD